MTKQTFLFLVAVSFLNVFSFPSLTNALGSGSTLAVVYGTATVCAIVAAEPNQRIICYRAGGDFSSSPAVISISPNVSYSAVAGGRTNFCAIRSGGYSLLCWDTTIQSLPSKRLYNNDTVLLQSLSVGDELICATAMNNTPPVTCWRTGNNTEELPNSNLTMGKITSGFGFTCGIVLSQNRRVTCWGSNSMAAARVNQFGNMSMENIEAGANHVCGVNSEGELVCRGDNSTGQLDVPSNKGLNFASGLALGDGFSCGIRRSNGTVVCWGSMNETAIEGIQFESIVAGVNFTCGLTTRNFSIICWGPGWPELNQSSSNSSINELPLGAEILPGPCTDSSCNECGPGSNSGPPSRSLTIRQQGSRSMKRQRSGTSSSKHADRAEEFSLVELAAATNNFALENKIGAGSFGIVYRGKLFDGREVAIKRGETGQKTKKFQEKETAFESELAFLSRLHHKHLVRLVGYCQERDERLLVYEYMKNGALYNHLHDKDNVEKSSSLLNSWKMRIKIALDAARGIEYLHYYAVPTIIHRDIKSSNILLDEHWTARVSDFGLSLMGPESDKDYRPMKAVGTVGYIDPEYYGLNVLTTKSDVYGLGVVMLELLTGKRAIFKNDENEGTPISLVDFAVPAIMAGELGKVLDVRVGQPEMNESEAVELMAYTAMHCVNLEGKERPTIGDIVSNLERAVTVCNGSHYDSISSGGFSIVSE
ncbi:hypothetical protein GOBAR_AA31885 [Gossypium barbadense]|uniref:non-specific serine/threonine protein kinase n=1 Tax=Gossypium barbadense TaxID=3634 RepID=A0A2P5WCI5_GOSBA|nr:hypothetical protein GOBAR_AA31885 [Gossypium barbadense]